MPERFDIDALCVEVLSHMQTLSPFDYDYDNQVIREKLPLLTQTFKEFVIPEVIDFVKRSYEYDSREEDYIVRFWAMNYSRSVSTPPHSHRNDFMVAILYLTDTKTPLYLMDPRGSACRGMPEEIFVKYFENYKFLPKPGDLIIFPSYIYHCICGDGSNDRELRLLVPSNFTLKGAWG